MKLINSWKFLITLTVLFWTVANVFLKVSSSTSHTEWRVTTLWWMIGAIIGQILLTFVFKKHLHKATLSYKISSVSGIMCAASIGINALLYSFCDASKIAPILGLATPLSGVVCLILFKEKLTWKIAVGLCLASLAIYLLG